MYSIQDLAAWSPLWKRQQTIVVSTACRSFFQRMSESRTKSNLILNQNLRIRKIVDTHQHIIQDLEVDLWELHDTSACSIAQLKNLKRLSIRLDHPHTRLPGDDRQFWESSPGSTVWTNLASKTEKTTLGRLRSLNLERAGITNYQWPRCWKATPCRQSHACRNASL